MGALSSCRRSPRSARSRRPSPLSPRSRRPWPSLRSARGARSVRASVFSAFSSAVVSTRTSFRGSPRASPRRLSRCGRSPLGRSDRSVRSPRSGRSLRAGRVSLSRPSMRPSERRPFSREPSRGARLSPVMASPRSPRRPPRRPSRRSLSRRSLSRRDSGVLMSFLTGSTGAWGVVLEPKRFFNQAKKPPPVEGAVGAAAATAGAWTALGAGLAISGLA